MEKKDFIVWASRLQADYQPAADVLEQLKNVELVAIVGPTGVGKSTIIKALELPEVLSDVTRDKRPDEKDGKNYHFKNDYLKIIDDIKQGRYVQFLISSTGEFYGTLIDAYPKSGPCAMAIYADAVDHFKQIGFKKITQFYIMPPSYIEWMRRIGGVRTKDLLGRIGEARKSILMGIEDESYHFILNDVLEIAIRDVRGVLNGEEPNEHRSQLAIGTADILLERIGDEL